MPRLGYGPPNAQYVIIGENYATESSLLSPGANSVLGSMLSEAGISPSECYFTALYGAPRDVGDLIASKKKDRTPTHQPRFSYGILPELSRSLDRLLRELEAIRPACIITLGRWSLWALTGADGIKKWRGSQLDFEGTSLIPTYSPNTILADWSLRAPAVIDLKRAARPSRRPSWTFIVRPSCDTVVSTLTSLQARAENEIWIDLDIETRGGHIACLGLSWSLTEGLCIPFMCVESQDGYWSLEEEALLVHMLYQLLTTPSVKVRWQNGLYDAQYIHRYWHFIPNGAQDTMISHHTLFAGLPKSLAFQASIYCDHYVYWKDDGKTWTKDVGEDQLWAYNLEDCVRTRECGEVSAKALEESGLGKVDSFQQKLFYPVLSAMIRGIRVDTSMRNRLIGELQTAMEDREEFMSKLLGHPLNPRSAPQMKRLFYEDLQQPVIMSKAKKGVPGHPTLDEKALEALSRREPLLKPLVEAILQFRSLGVFLGTFVLAPLDVDGRMRCSYNICGTETYRFNSSANAFDSGTNLQNLPKGDESGLFPNIRRLFIPDPGYTFFDMDLDRADLQVVAWEADEPELKAALRLGVDMHLLNAYTLAEKSTPPLEELVQSDPKYESHLIPYKKGRELAKNFIHGTNYGGKARTMAIAGGVTTHQAERFQNIYFGRYPGIARWHASVDRQLKLRRYVENRFGYRRFYFDRLDGLLPEALAWIPQSTVACYINRIWMKIYEQLPAVQVLLQVHDSLAGQIPTHKKDALVNQIKNLSRIPIPYEDPLIIPIGIKTSEKSWGDCE